jgi:hypothetical protein
MGLNLKRHVEEEELERYSTRAMNEAQAAGVEEHLLVCETCRRRLDEAESFLRGVNAAGRKIRDGSSLRAWFAAHPRMALALAASIALIAGPLALQRMWGPASEAAPVAVFLETTRGAGGVARAPGGIRLALEPDLSGIPAFGRYSLEIVDSAGTAVWQGVLPGGARRAITPKREPGTYFVRVYSPSHELLREYGLQIGR